MEETKDISWDIQADEIKDNEVGEKFSVMLKNGRSMMEQRTKGHKLFSRVSHMQNLFDDKDGVFSEGTTQAIKRRTRAESIQRTPTGEIRSQYDKNSIEQAELEFIFNNKIMRSEHAGRDRLKDLWRAFDASYDYGYGCVRTGFDTDYNDEIRVTWTLIQWNDVIPAPDCDFIENAEWYMVREYLSHADLWALLDENGEPYDSSYEAKTIQYLIENHIHSAENSRSRKLADHENGATKTESIEIITLYKRGADEFITFVPDIQAVLKRTPNYDPRKDVPLHFLILEPDPDFPLGCSSIMWTLSQQQFADAFQTTSYQALLLAANPPLLAFGNLTNARLRMQPRAIWDMGTNPNNKIEKFPVETTTLTQYGSILNNVSANMMKNLNMTEQTVATDAQAMSYSATAAGVKQQQNDKSTTVNQYTKRIEIFYGEWACHALRSYINAMGGVQEMTVDEHTRRRVWDIESAMSEKDPETGMPIVDSIIEDNKISIDFDKLSSDMLEFEVRTGSLIQGEKEDELQKLQELIVPVSQMMGNVSDQNRSAFENVLMQIVARIMELSNIDISAKTAEPVKNRLVEEAMQATMEKVMQMQQQLDGMQQQMQNALPAAPDHGMPMEPGMDQGLQIPQDQMNPDMNQDQSLLMPPDMAMPDQGMNNMSPEQAGFAPGQPAQMAPMSPM